MRTALAYLASLVCHGAVLIPLANLPVCFDRPPACTTSQGAPAVALEASMVESDGPVDREMQVVMELTPQAFQQTVEPPRPEMVTSLPMPRQSPTVEPIRLELTEAKPLGLRPSESPPMPRREASSSPDNERLSSQNEPSLQRASPRRAKLTNTEVLVSAAGSSVSGNGAVVDQPPSKLSSNPIPPYPPDALAKGIGGVVLLRVRIGADGAVEHASIEKSSGVPTFDQSALSTVQRFWRFQPAMRDGEPVPYEATLPIRFTFRNE